MGILLDSGRFQLLLFVKKKIVKNYRKNSDAKFLFCLLAWFCLSINICKRFIVNNNLLKIRLHFYRSDVKDHICTTYYVVCLIVLFSHHYNKRYLFFVCSKALSKIVVFSNSTTDRYHLSVVHKLRLKRAKIVRGKPFLNTVCSNYFVKDTIKIAFLSVIQIRKKMYTKT